MIYPIIVLFIASGVVALITVFLLPMFMSFLQDFNRKIQLPLPSRVLMAFSQFVQSFGWWLMPAVMIGTPFLLFRFYKTDAGKALMDRLVLMMPVFGPLCRKIDTTRFARTLSVLLDAGLDYGSSIDLTADVLMMKPDPERRPLDPPEDPGGRRPERDPRRVSPVLPGRDRRDLLGRGDGEAAGEPPSPGRRLRGTGRLDGQEPGPARAAHPARLPGRDRPLHHPGRLLALYPDDHDRRREVEDL